MTTTRIVMPEKARKGEVIEIRTIVRHDMETGHRRDHTGRPIPRNIVHTFTVTYAGEEIFRMELFPGVAANPYVAFTTVAMATGDLEFTWIDDQDNRTVETRRLTVT